jgi:NAD(P)-dependent dehydrogenase (short-subunit alcohol dehydrogenase family)
LVVTRALASQGANVYVCDISTKAPAEISNQSNIHFVGGLDISDRKQCAQFFDDIPGRIEGLVNCAGICPLEGQMATDDIFTRVMEVNVRGTWNMTTEAFKRMSRQEQKKSIPGLLPEYHRTPGAGRVVNFASGAGIRGIANIAAYCASKHAVVGLTRAWAKDWPTLRINAVAPGTLYPIARS